MDFHGQKVNLSFSIENILRDDFPHPRKTNVIVSVPTRTASTFDGWPKMPVYHCGYEVRFSPLLMEYPPNAPSCSSGRVGGKIHRQYGDEKRFTEDSHDRFDQTKKLADEEGAKDNKRQPKTETCLSENVPKRKRRNRSHFTQRQLQYLEKIFSRQQYLTRDERTLLARGLEMTELQIRNWFQNQRYQKKHRANENKKQEKLEFSVNGEKSQPWTIIQESVGHSKWRIPACNLHGELSFAFCKEASVELVKQRTAQTEAKDQQ